MRNKVYNSHNIFALVAVFIAVFGLLYLIASSLHEGKKIADEIALIETNNEKLREKILEKQAELEYLQTPQRIEKDAKTQLGKKRPNEKVLIFIEEKLDFLPPEEVLASESEKIENELLKNATNWQKWSWLFFGEKE